MRKDLLKRLEWIAKCGLLADLQLVAIPNWKTNTTRYFSRCFSIWTPVIKWGRASVEFTPLDTPICHHLGSYPNHWNMQKNAIMLPHEAGGPYDFPMGSQPTILDTYLTQGEIKEFNEFIKKWGRPELDKALNPDRVPWEEVFEYFNNPSMPGYQIRNEIKMMSLFYRFGEVEAWVRQKFELEDRRAAFLRCIRKYYPPTRITPQTKVYKTTPEQTFPGEPMSDLTLPTPIGPRAREGEKYLQLTIKFGIKETTPYNALELTSEIIGPVEK